MYCHPPQWHHVSACQPSTPPGRTMLACHTTYVQRYLREGLRAIVHGLLGLRRRPRISARVVRVLERCSCPAVAERDAVFGLQLRRARGGIDIAPGVAAPALVLSEVIAWPVCLAGRGVRPIARVPAVQACSGRSWCAFAVLPCRAPDAHICRRQTRGLVSTSPPALPILLLPI